MTDRHNHIRRSRRQVLAIAVTAVVAATAGFALGSSTADPDPSSPSAEANGKRSSERRARPEFRLADDVVEPTIQSRSGRATAVQPDALEGYVERTTTSKAGAAISGWAVTATSRSPASQILLFAGGRLLRSVRPTRERPDVVSALGADTALKSGFAVTIPLAEVDRGHKSGAIRVFAIGGGKATELPRLQ